MSKLTRTHILIILLVATASLGFLAYPNLKSAQHALEELLWILIGAVFTAFMIEGLLNRDLENRRAKESEFAFRTFVAVLLSRICSIRSEDHETLAAKAIGAVTSSSGEFATTVKQVANVLHTSQSVDASRYNALYISVGEELRRLSTDYIRVFARSEQEIVQSYLAITRIADRWIYFDALSDWAQEAIKGAGEGEHATLALKSVEAKEEVVSLTNETVHQLVELARRATRKGLRLKT
ncbi:hypothetical protein HNP84_009617 [Thermocatellispora tengchongensis]|uniref:Uncharacterized protein n=1 Tax=Thermocatellispora tengchongensis TaxID=1073253 RepID=A0A840PP73_9ACTN|nr:hypothetical protein [Thermocatellispora tengchongensis]MBB5139853.1 hypothetical protein [Thermocatellispora tengchongensis]